MKLELNMTRDYCSHWDDIKAIAELAQNCLDITTNGDFTVLDGKVQIITPQTTIPMTAFAMGESQKSANSIGGYGEGMKVAMMILTRSGLNPVIYTGQYKITGGFETHPITEAHSFCLHFEDTGTHYEHTKFSCDMGDFTEESLAERITMFSEMPLPKLSKGDVGILYTRPGLMYVNGLYICKEDNLTFGYNFSPDKVSLNRDRDMVDGVISSLAQYYVEQTDKAELIFDLIERDARDVSYVYIYLYKNDKLKAELARLFHNKYGEGATISKPGTTYVGGTYNRVACSTSGYNTFSACGIKSATKAADPNAPVELVKTFVEDNKKHMRSKACQNAAALINQAKSWKQG